MKPKAFIRLLIAGLIFLTSCQKNVDFFSPDPLPFDTAWFEALPANAPVYNLLHEIELPVESDSFDITNSIINVALSSGLHCTLESGLLVDSLFNPVTSKININSIRLLKKGDIIRQGKSTNTDTALIDCSNISFLSLEQYGKKIIPREAGTISINYAENAYYASLQLFYPGANNNWIKNHSPFNKIVQLNSGYELRINNLDWVCAGNFLDVSANQTTSVQVKLPINYTNANSIAYLILKNKNTAVRLRENIAAKQFYHSFIPKTEAGSIVVISKQVDDYYLGTTNFEGLNGVPLEVKPVKKSFEEIIQFLNAL